VYLLLPPHGRADICHLQYTITHWGLSFYLITIVADPVRFSGDLTYLQNQYWARHFGRIGKNITERMLSNSLTRSTCLRLAQWPLWPKVSWLRDTGSCARLYHCVEAQLLTRSRTRNKVITLTLFFFITVAVSFYPSSTLLNFDFNRR
jgi:hypothetical protein